MNQQAIDYINSKIEKYKKVVSDMDKKYIGNEIKYTYHGGFDHGYAKGKLTALEDMKDELQDIPENNSQANSAIAVLDEMIKENIEVRNFDLYGSIKMNVTARYIYERIEEEITRAKEKIQALDDGWIKCNDDNIKNTGKVLCISDTGEMMVGLIGTNNIGSYTGIDSSDTPLHSVTHYMPLPNPPIN